MPETPRICSLFAAAIGLPGYAFQGIYKEFQKHLGSSVQSYIVAARTAQGYEEWHNSNQEERLDVVSRWQAIQVEIEKEKQQTRHGKFHGHHCYLQSTIQERKKQSLEKKNRKKAGEGKDGSRPSATIPESHPFIRQQTEANAKSADFEEAIQASVAATSKGNPDEDKMIEQAIRASVLELQTATQEGDDEDAVQRAIKASVAEAARVGGKDNPASKNDGLDGVSDHDQELEAALRRSMAQHSLSDSRDPPASMNFDDSGVDTDDDENMKIAIKKSMSDPSEGSKPTNQKDEDFDKALQLSKQAQEDHEQGLKKSKTEEEIVLEYVKKQSLAEEQHKRSVATE